MRCAFGIQTLGRSRAVEVAPVDSMKLDLSVMCKSDIRKLAPDLPLVSMPSEIHYHDF
jgi:hypothetical protein